MRRALPKPLDVQAATYHVCSSSGYGCGAIAIAGDPDNLVLAQLREIRADIGVIKSKLEDHDRRFDKLDKDNETFKFQLTHTFGLAGMANLQSQLAQEKADEALERQKRMDAQFAEIERRLSRVEEPQEN